MIIGTVLQSALKLYKQVVTQELIDSVKASSDVVSEQRGGIFSTAVVVWLMIFQRLSGDHSLLAAIEHLKLGDTRELLLTSGAGSIKARNGRISRNTGGYCQGRQRIALSVVEQITDSLNEALSRAGNTKKVQKEKIYAIDGTTILISHSQKNVKEYSQHKTRMGVSHYPLIRVTLATEMTSGVAMRPAVGAHNGSKATSEIAQAHEVLDKLEKGSIVLADRLFGITQIVHKTETLGLKLIVRLKDSVANRLSKEGDKKSGEQAVIWRPSEYEQKRYPYLAGVEIPGRYIWKTIQRDGFRPVKLLLFTTCDKSVAEVVALYGLRWNIEQDLRDLKTTLELNFINAKSPDMVQKEILSGIAAYNLVRHFMKVTAKQLNTTVRGLSFKGFLRILATLENIILTSSSDDKLNIKLQSALTDMKFLKHPNRKKPRVSQPRLKWRKGVQRYRTCDDSLIDQSNDFSKS